MKHLTFDNLIGQIEEEADYGLTSLQELATRNAFALLRQATLLTLAKGLEDANAKLSTKWDDADIPTAEWWYEKLVDMLADDVQGKTQTGG